MRHSILSSPNLDLLFNIVHIFEMFGAFLVASHLHELTQRLLHQLNHFVKGTHPREQLCPEGSLALCYRDTLSLSLGITSHYI